EAGPEDGVDDRGRTVEARESLGRVEYFDPGQPAVVRKGVGAQVVDGIEHEYLGGESGFDQVAGGHEAVAGVVALAAHDPDRARTGHSSGRPGEGAPRGFHEVEGRYAALFGRPAVGGAHP